MSKICYKLNEEFGTLLISTHLVDEAINSMALSQNAHLGLTQKIFVTMSFQRKNVKHLCLATIK